MPGSDADTIETIALQRDSFRDAAEYNKRRAKDAERQRDLLSDLCDTLNADLDEYRAENRDLANQLADALWQRDELLVALEYAYTRLDDPVDTRLIVEAISRVKESK